jgi:hypothetical protein
MKKKTPKIHRRRWPRVVVVRPAVVDDPVDAPSLLEPMLPVLSQILAVVHQGGQDRQQRDMYEAETRRAVVSLVEKQIALSAEIVQLLAAKK